MKKIVFLVLLLSFGAQAGENPCKGEKGADVRLRMAEAAAEGIFNANTFGLSMSAPSLWDAKESTVKKDLINVTVEFRDLSEDPNTKANSLFYKSTIDLKKCKVLKVEEVKSL